MLDDGQILGSRPYQPSRRDIDIATGILVGLRGFTEHDAFAELVKVAHHTGAGISNVSRALIATAGGRSVPTQSRSDAVAIWGDVLYGDPPVVRSA